MRMCHNVTLHTHTWHNATDLMCADISKRASNQSPTSSMGLQPFMAGGHTGYSRLVRGPQVVEQR